MNPAPIHTPDPSSTLLAIVVAANGRVDAREVAALDRLNAYERLGVQRDWFLGITHAALEEIGTRLSQTRWLRWDDRWRVCALQQAVVDPGRRLLVCRLSAAVITADGRVTDEERQVYSLLQDGWGVTQAMVTKAIMRDPLH